MGTNCIHDAPKTWMEEMADRINTLIQNYVPITVWNTVFVLYISVYSAEGCIINHHYYQKVCAYWIPWMLTDEFKRHDCTMLIHYWQNMKKRGMTFYSLLSLLMKPGYIILPQKPQKHPSSTKHQKQTFFSSKKITAQFRDRLWEAL